MTSSNLMTIKAPANTFLWLGPQTLPTIYTLACYTLNIGVCKACDVTEETAHECSIPFAAPSNRMPACPPWIQGIFRERGVTYRFIYTSAKVKALGCSGQRPLDSRPAAMCLPEALLISFLESASLTASPPGSPVRFLASKNKHWVFLPYRLSGGQAQRGGQGQGPRNHGDTRPRLSWSTWCSHCALHSAADSAGIPKRHFTAECQLECDHTGGHNQTQP